MAVRPTRSAKAPNPAPEPNTTTGHLRCVVRIHDDDDDVDAAADDDDDDDDDVDDDDDDHYRRCVRHSDH